MSLRSRYLGYRIDKLNRKIALARIIYEVRKTRLEETPSITNQEATVDALIRCDTLVTKQNKLVDKLTQLQNE